VGPVELTGNPDLKRGRSGLNPRPFPSFWETEKAQQRLFWFLECAIWK